VNKSKKLGKIPVKGKQDRGGTREKKQGSEKNIGKNEKAG